jgi:hypothetical protein
MCIVIAVFTAIVAGMSLWLGRPVLGIDAWAFADAVIFGIAGWRVWRLSRIWAVLALVIYIMETVYAVEATSGSVPAAGAYLRVLFTLVLISGVRGTFAYYAFKRKESAASFGTTVGSSQ